MPLSLTVSDRAATTVVELSGEIDISTTARLRRALQDLLVPGAVSVVVDMSQVHFMDSSGIGVLVAAHRRAQQHDVAFTLAHPTPIVAKVLSLTGVDQLVSVAPGQG